MPKRIYILAAVSLALLLGFSGCSNFDSTLSPAEDLTVEPVGEVTVLSKSPSCVGVLAAAFALNGLDEEVELVKGIAEATGVPFGQVVTILAHQTGNVTTCLALLGL